MSWEVFRALIEELRRETEAALQLSTVIRALGRREVGAEPCKITSQVAYCYL